MAQVSKAYAQALFALAAEAKQTGEYAEALDAVQQLIGAQPDYLEFLAAPVLPLSERTQALEEAFGGAFPAHIVSFLKILCENGHIRALNSCVEEYRKLVMAAENRAVAVVYSAVALRDDQKAALCAKLARHTGKRIEPVYRVDAALIGGLRIEIDGKTYDGSLRQQLHEVKEVIYE